MRNIRQGQKSPEPGHFWQMNMCTDTRFAEIKTHSFHGARWWPGYPNRYFISHRHAIYTGQLTTFRSCLSLFASSLAVAVCYIILNAYIWIGKRIYHILILLSITISLILCPSPLHISYSNALSLCNSHL